jgi:hypothetical protein
MILLIARHLTVWRTGGAQRSLARAAAWLAGVGAAAGAAALYLVWHTQAPAPDTDLASLLQQNPGDYALSFGHFLDLNARAMGMFRVPLGLTFLSLGVGLVAAWWLRKKGHGDLTGWTTAGSAFVFLIAAWQGLVIFSPTLTSEQMAQVIARQMRPQDLIVLHGEYEAGSTLGFYLRRNDLHLVEGRSSNLWYGSFFPDAPKIFETRESMAQRWTGPQRIFLWQDPSDKDRPVLALPGPVFVIASAGGKQILSNQPGR